MSWAAISKLCKDGCSPAGWMSVVGCGPAVWRAEALPVPRVQQELCLLKENWCSKHLESCCANISDSGKRNKVKSQQVSESRPFLARGETPAFPPCEITPCWLFKTCRQGLRFWWLPWMQMHTYTRGCNDQCSPCEHNRIKCQCSNRAALQGYGAIKWRLRNDSEGSCLVLQINNKPQGHSVIIYFAK